MEFVGLKFGIFGGFGWVHNSILVDESGFEWVRSLVFPDFGLFLTEQVGTLGFFEGIRKGSKFGFGG